MASGANALKSTAHSYHTVGPSTCTDVRQRRTRWRTLGLGAVAFVVVVAMLAWASGPRRASALWLPEFFSRLRPTEQSPYWGPLNSAHRQDGYERGSFRFMRFVSLVKLATKAIIPHIHGRFIA